MTKLNDRKSLISLRNECRRKFQAESKRILVCAGNGCRASGSLEIYDKFRSLLSEKGIPCSVDFQEEPDMPDSAVGLKKSGCQGCCEMGVLIRVEPQGYLYTKVKLDDCEEIIQESILNDNFIERLAYKKDGVVYKTRNKIPFYKNQHIVVLENCGNIDATNIKDYLAADGYTAFEKALFDMTPDEVIEEVTESKLRGRGGGGFPTGRKWGQVKRQKTEQKYIVCNGDEGDPGAFMDGSIMEGDPHRMLEGMMIAGLACGSDTGYIYVRAEYPVAVERLGLAIKDLESYGLLGDNILGTGFSFRLKINRGAGAFVCGEGSALTASIEGKRGMPRVKPPRTVEQGLFAKPTVLNNVETFANVPAIVNRGASWYKGYGTEDSPGTKAFSLTGNIEHTGMIEVAMGTTLREVIFDIGGGVRGGGKFKAVQIGGPSGGCLTEAQLDMPLDFDSLKKAGAMIGSGGLVVLDSDTCMVEVSRFFMNFTRNESCGKCVPCREGTKRMLAILEDIVEGRGEEGDIEMLLELADTIKATALCGLGKSAPQPVVSTITNFRNEYEAHIKDKRCPAGNCSKLRLIYINKDECKGCAKCAKICPVNAISGERKQPFEIDPKVCIKCGACIEACSFDAIKEEA